ncbi:heparan-alpha-glucosaminide N-acetyltransferase domain-containing protein [Agromyces aurantiacus]|uniref:Heparan-alpha-glucosaminide N-acetyltransferase domain-containing protein n=1 Tax=Agromyces aurantiacus TaxID=165814 RepID=A0ABV9R6R3_9MICO|nr:heparan-alpha-glucosaminide N-acetyltransferase domain-containing protein [Agromyces aurantiacus]MBM7504005.1 putative membrane protein [Agromyces aurantiacus]
MIDPGAGSGSGASAWLSSRVTGVDAARGLALIGMFVAHVAPDVASDSLADVIAIAHERPRLLFALTAGVGLGLLTGATRPAIEHRGTLRRQIAIRAIILIALGVLIVTLLKPLVFVILDVYGVAFLLMLPVLFVPGRVAIGLGSALLVVTPAAAALAERDSAVRAASDGAAGFAVDWFLTGAYPVIVWVPVMLIGLGIARLDVARASSVRRYGAVGLAAAVLCMPLGYAIPENQVLGADPSADWMVPARASLTTIGNVGFGLVVIAVLVALTALSSRTVRAASSVILAPIIAMGAMPLTIYTLHLVVISAGERVENGVVTDDSWPMLLGLVLGSMAFAWLWQRYLGRGPFERLLRWASGRARQPAER